MARRKKKQEWVPVPRKEPPPKKEVAEPLYPKAGRGTMTITPNMTKAMRQKVFLREWPRKNYDVEKTCEVIGLSPSAVRKWRACDPDFKRRMGESMAAATDKLFAVGLEVALGVHESSAGRPDPSMIRHYQQKLDERFTPTSKVVHTGSVSHVHTAVLQGMTEEEKVKQLRDLLSEEELSGIELEVTAEPDDRDEDGDGEGD